MPNHVLADHDCGLPVLHRYAARGDLAGVTAVLDEPGAVHRIDATMGASALHYAAQGGAVAVMDVLIEAGALINLQAHSHGMTPLMVAVWHRQAAAVERLLAHPDIDVDITARTGARAEQMVIGPEDPGQNAQDVRIGAALRSWRQAQRPSALFAVLNDPALPEAEKLDRLRALLRNGADPNAVAGASDLVNPGHSPLLVAAREGLAEIVALLLEAGADMTLVGNFMRAHPAHKAGYMGHAAVLRVLVGHADFAQIANAQGPFNGYTALHDAAWHGHEDAVRILLAAGVRTDLEGYDGLTPAQLAARNGYDAIAALIAGKTG